MAANKDYYEILGVSKDADDKTLKSAYRKLALKWHPDHQVGKTDAEKQEATQKFQEISEAYSVLSDPDKRRRYDQFGSCDDGASAGGWSGFDGGFDPFEMFRNMGGFRGFGRRSPFGEDGYSSTPDFDSPEDGNDVQMKFDVDFKDALFGGAKEFTLTLDSECGECHGHGYAGSAKPETCVKCHGTGRVREIRRQGFMQMINEMPCPECHGAGYSAKPCPKCGGTKRVPDRKTVKIRIPKGAYDGLRLRLAGMGQCGVKGGHSGTLYVVLHVVENEYVKRDGADLYMDMHISPATATLGGTVPVKTPYGEIEVKIDPNTKSGDVHRLRGMGVDSEFMKRGDLYLRVMVEPYSNITDEQRNLLKRLLELETPSNNEEFAKQQAEIGKLTS